MKIQRIALIGGSGFVGRHLAGHLRNRGYQCRVITRHAHRHYDLRPAAEVVEADPFDHTQLTSALHGCDTAINLVGVLNSGGKENSFRRVHVELVENVVAACHTAKIVRLLHMSALNADQASGGSLYLRSKGEGENRAHTLGKPGIAVTSFRPSVIFGPDDSFSIASPSCCEYPAPCRWRARMRGCRQCMLVMWLPHSPMHWKTGPPSASTMSCADPGPTPWSNWCALSPGTAANAKSSCACRTGHRACRPRSCNMPPGKPFTPDNYLSLRTPSVCREKRPGRARGNCHLTGKCRHTFSDPHGQESAT